MKAEEYLASMGRYAAQIIDLAGDEYHPEYMRGMVEFSAQILGGDSACNKQLLIDLIEQANERI